MAQYNQEEDDDVYQNEVKLIELLDDLNLEDSNKEEALDNEDDFINEFIKRLDHIKVEK